jgi:hypothetical protein
MACWGSPYNQPEFWLLRAAPGQNGRFAALGPGGGLGPRVRPYHLPLSNSMGFHPDLIVNR